MQFPNGRYWWMTTNPDTYEDWSLFEMAKGKSGEGACTLKNRNGHYRGTPEAFRAIRKGDYILGYVGGHSHPRGVYSLLRCTRALSERPFNGEDYGAHICFEKVCDLEQYIPWDVFANSPALKDARMVKLNNSGCLFGFTDKEQVALLKLLRRPCVRRFWTYTPGSSARGDWDFDADLRDGVMGLRQNALGDLRQYGKSIKRLARDMRRSYKVEGDGSGNARYMIMFRDEMQRGDIVFVKHGKSHLAGVGIVAGDYRFAARRKESKQVRAVNWIRHFDAMKKVPFEFPITTLTSFSDSEKIKSLLSLAKVTENDFVRHGRPRPTGVAGTRKTNKHAAHATAEASPKELAARLAAITRTVKLRETVQRAGQQELRAYMLSKRGKCAVTGLKVQPLLVVSHIKDWTECTRDERLDPHNVLLLSANYDAVFDQKWISFDASGRIVKSDTITWQQLAALGIKRNAKVPRPNQFQAKYLSWHRARLCR